MDHRALHYFDFVWDFDVSWPCCLQNVCKSEREGDNCMQCPIVVLQHDVTNTNANLLVENMPI